MRTIIDFSTFEAKYTISASQKRPFKWSKSSTQKRVKDFFSNATHKDLRWFKPDFTLPVDVIQNMKGDFPEIEDQDLVGDLIGSCLFVFGQCLNSISKFGSIDFDDEESFNKAVSFAKDFLGLEKIGIDRLIVPYLISGGKFKLTNKNGSSEDFDLDSLVNKIKNAPAEPFLRILKDEHSDSDIFEILKYLFTN